MYGFVANAVGDKVLRDGARVWISRCNGDAERPRVIGISRGGRVIEKFVPYKRLRRLRIAWIPHHMRSRVAWRWDTKDQAVAHLNKYIPLSLRN